MITRELSEAAIEIWGLERQTDMCIEEVGEFLSDWNKFKRGRVTKRKYIEEMVDCYIMFSQMRHIYGELFEEVLSNKVDRIERKIEKQRRTELKENKKGV